MINMNQNFSNNNQEVYSARSNNEIIDGQQLNNQKNNNSDARLQSPINNFPKRKNLIITAIMIFIVVVGIGIFLIPKLFYSNSPSGNINTENEKKLKWKIVVNGKEYNIPTNLTNFTNNGFYYDSTYGELKDETDDKLDRFTQRLLLYPPDTKWYSKEYVEFPDAGFTGFGSMFEVYLVHKKNTSSDYKNYLVAGFSIFNVSSEFFSVNGIGCGSTIDELISALKIDINDENFSQLSVGEGTNISYVDVKNNVAISASTEITGQNKGKIQHIQIFINDREYLKEN